MRLGIRDGGIGKGGERRRCGIERSVLSVLLWRLKRRGFGFGFGSGGGVLHSVVSSPSAFWPSPLLFLISSLLIFSEPTPSTSFTLNIFLATSHKYLPAQILK